MAPQAHLNQYLSEGPSTRYAVRTFIVWLIKNKEIGRLEIPHRYAATKPLVTQQQRLDLIRHCIESTRSPLGFRVAALILMLFGQPVGKIAALKCLDLKALPEGLHLGLGNTPVLVPAQIAPMFWDYLHDRPNQQTGNGGSQWLFPGTLPSQHIHADAMMGQLRALGIHSAEPGTPLCAASSKNCHPPWSQMPWAIATKSSTNTPLTPASRWPATQVVRVQLLRDPDALTSVAARRVPEQLRSDS